MACFHQSSHKKIWVPMENGLLEKHAFCKHCGVVKVKSSNRGKDVGYFINALSELKKYVEKRGYRISQSQIRLILKEFVDEGFSDTYSITFSQQKENFIRIVRKYVNISAECISSFI